MRIFDKHFHIIDFNFLIIKNEGYYPPNFVVEDYQIDAIELPEIASTIEKLPAISIDHLWLSEEGLPHLLKIVDKGGDVKAIGFGRVELDVENVLKSIYEVNPDALMFGTDFPSTRAKRPFEYGDIKLIQQLFDEQATDNILYTNAFKWYFG
ncbi:amidohydrolase family protein [Bacillus cereus]|uniref:amidohydrolase family protein n=1 Tax=Bacillus cereus TaxID=1396 RepID=UPI000B49A406|nr:amidohydrolase family protein [Bacillus cereus]